jgi:hypothetical protein
MLRIEFDAGFGLVPKTCSTTACLPCEVISARHCDMPAARAGLGLVEVTAYSRYRWLSWT